MCYIFHINCLISNYQVFQLYYIFASRNSSIKLGHTVQFISVKCMPPERFRPSILKSLSVLKLRTPQNAYEVVKIILFNMQRGKLHPSK